MNEIKILVGNYEECGGIWEVSLCPETGQRIYAGPVVSSGRNSYLSLNGSYCFAVSETPMALGEVGSIHSFLTASKQFALISTLKGQPCLLPHLCVDRRATILYTASYGTGQILALRILPDGRFGKTVFRDKNSGSSTHPIRQTSSHPHSLWLSTEEENLYLCDLGTDEIIVWNLNEEKVPLAATRRSLNLPSGYGIRHLALHPEGDTVYGLCELNFHLLVMHRNSSGDLVLLRDIALDESIPADQLGGGAIRLYGTELICTNRGGDFSRIDVLDISNPGVPRHKQTLTDCQWPRDFLLTPDGCMLICGNQTDNSLSVFRRENKTQPFSFLRKVEDIPTPVCLVIPENRNK